MKKLIKILKEGIKEIQSNGDKKFQFLSGFRIINGKWHYNETLIKHCTPDLHVKMDHYLRISRELENA